MDLSSHPFRGSDIDRGERRETRIRTKTMQIRAGYELIYECPQPTPMVLMLNIHHTRAADMVVPDRMITDPLVPDTRTGTASGTGAHGWWRRWAACG